MTEATRCPRCRRVNPPENRFCGWCGTSLGASSDLVPRRGDNPTVMSHALPVKPGAVGKALAVGLGALAVRAVLSWLSRRTTAVDRSSTLTTREHDTAGFERLLGQRLEEVLIQELRGKRSSRTFAWRAVRSIVVTEWTSSKKSSAGGSRGAESGAGFRASSSPSEPGR